MICTLRIALVLLLASCGVTVLGPEDSGDCDRDVEETLDARWVEPYVRVTHHRYQINCCKHVSHIDARVDGDVIELSYRKKGHICDCICYREIIYQLKGVRAGTWTLDAEGTTTVVEVD